MVGDDRRQRIRSPGAIVVLDHIVEVAGLLELFTRLAQPVLDHPRALGGTVAETALELLDGRGHKHGDGALDAALHPFGALRLELEQRRVARRPEAVDLAPERPVAVADEVHVLQEVAGLDTPVELPTVEKPVMSAVLL